MPQESISSKFIIGQRIVDQFQSGKPISQLLNCSMSEVIVIVPDDLALTLRL
jgi:hypothetical protein